MSGVFTGKISKITFNKQKEGKSGMWYYYKINFEGDSKDYSIGTNVKDPQNFKVGCTIQYEFNGFFDGSISEVNPKSETKTTTPTYVDNSVGLMVGNALSNAAILVSHGITDPEQVKKVYEVANLICGFSSNLKTEFSNNKN